MELTASGVRFLLNPAALDALVSLLALPAFREARELTPADKEAGIAWLKENGYLSQEGTEKPVLSRELAFMITGLCAGKNAVLWQEKEKTCMVACRFEGIWLLCYRMRVGKWAITPYAEEDAFRQELEERLSLVKKAQPVRRGQTEALPQSLSAAECIQLLHQKKE